MYNSNIFKLFSLSLLMCPLVSLAMEMQNFDEDYLFHLREAPNSLNIHVTLEEIEAYSKAIINGVDDALVNFTNSDPIDDVLMPITDLIHDSAVIMAKYSPKDSGTDMQTLQYLIEKSPQIYNVSAQRMQGRLDAMKKATGDFFYNASGPEKVRMLVSMSIAAGAIIWVPGKVFMRIRAIIKATGSSLLRVAHGLLNDRIKDTFNENHKPHITEQVDTDIISRFDATSPGGMVFGPYLLKNNKIANPTIQLTDHLDLGFSCHPMNIKTHFEEQNKQLIESAKVGDIKGIEQALQYGADIQTIDSSYYNFTPLHWASEYGHKDAVEMLIEYGANIRTQSTAGNSTPRDNGSILHPHMKEHFIKKDQELFEAAKKNDLDGIANALIGGANIQAIDNYYNFTPLHWASEYGHKDAVEMLIEYGANIRAQSTANNSTPRDNGSILHPHLKEHFDKKDQELFAKVKTGDLDGIANALIGGADIQAIDDYYNFTPLHWASEYGHKDAVEMLIKCGANVRAQSTANNSTPRDNGSILHPHMKEHFTKKDQELFAKVKTGDLDGIVKALTEGANVNAIDSYYAFRPVHWAAECGQLDAYTLLCEFGAEPTSRNVHNYTPHKIATILHPSIAPYIPMAGDEIVESPAPTQHHRRRTKLSRDEMRINMATAYNPEVHRIHNAMSANHQRTVSAQGQLRPHQNPQQHNSHSNIFAQSNKNRAQLQNNMTQGYNRLIAHENRNMAGGNNPSGAGLFNTRACAQNWNDVANGIPICVQK